MLYMKEMRAQVSESEGFDSSKLPLTVDKMSLGCGGMYA